MKNKISVIVPVYNVEKYLKKCIESVMNQTYKNLEIILVDDGSTDMSSHICEEYKAMDGRVVVVHQENGGLAAARNTGLQVMSGDLVAFVDSDDWIEPDTYERMLEVKTNTGATVVCCEGIHTDGENLYERCFHCKPTGTVLDGCEVVREILLDTIGSQVVKGLYERKCWESIRFPVGMLYEDIPVTFRAFTYADKVAFLNEPFYKYRINPMSISGKPNPRKPYDIFKGFESHYEFAKEVYPDISVQCCSNAAHYAISTYMHFCTDATETLALYQEEVCQFLDENKKNIDKGMIIATRRYALMIYYFSPRLFRILCGVFYKTGLQKKMKFDIK